ncbi:MAG: hypothetical protein ACOYUZ_03685 [Patescibacteria group bacterium]
MSENPFKGNAGEQSKSLLERLALPRYKYPALLAMAIPFAGGQVPMKRDIGSWSEAETSVSAPQSPTIDVAPRLKVVRGQVRIEHQLTPLMDAENNAVPQQYARHFDKAQALDKADYQKLVEATEQQILHDKANTLHNVASGSEVRGEGDLQNLRITGIHVTGFSSPEAFKHGAGAVEPGSVQEENIELARKRAYAAVADMQSQGVIEQFEQAGISADEQVLEEAAETLEGQEMQFSPEEVQTLNEVASHYPHYVNNPNATWRNIGTLIELYNTGYVSNPDHQKALHDIVAAKRNVIITIEYEGEVSETVHVPMQVVTENIPLVTPAFSTTQDKTVPMPLELYDPRTAPRVRIEKEEEDEPTPDSLKPEEEYPERDEMASSRRTIIPPPPEYPYEIFEGEEEPVPESAIPFDLLQTRRLWQEGIDYGGERETKVLEPKKEYKPTLPEDFDPERMPKLILETRKPEKGDEGFEWMMWQTYVKDLYPFFNDQTTIRRGCDYVQMMQDVYRSYEAFDNDEDRLNYLTFKLLTAWRAHDQQARREAQMHDLESGLDYFNQPKQIQWAKMHAEALLELVRQKRSLDRAFDRTGEAMAQRTVRAELNDPVRANYTVLLNRQTDRVRQRYNSSLQS